MRRRSAQLVHLLVIAACGAIAGSFSPSAHAAPPTLHTAFFDPMNLPATGGELLFRRVAESGARYVRLTLNWRAVAPIVRPPGFDETNPAEPAYRWASFDREVTLAVANGLAPVVGVLWAPNWAEARSEEGPPGGRRPNAAALGRFMRSAAARYGGSFGSLPRVRYWQVWNEPNLSTFLAPQLVGRRPFAPAHYGTMVNEVAAAVKAVHGDNLVVAGGTAPFRDRTPSVYDVNPQWGPLTFMRELFCLSRLLEPTCRTSVRFDVWAHHPYTSGGPTRHATNRDDVSIGDLPELKAVLDAARRAGHIASPRAPALWVTEFSWDSSPPDPRGVPSALQTRWVAEGLYRMWKHGVSLVTWFLVRDLPMRSSFFQSGLWYRGSTVELDKPKPALRAFRFPFVGFSEKRGVYVWGRTPGGNAGQVLVEQSFNGGWKRLGILRTNGHGLFQYRFRTGRRGWVRARVVGTGDRAVPFSLKRVPDRYFGAFGVAIEPGKPGD